MNFLRFENHVNERFSKSKRTSYRKQSCDRSIRDFANIRRNTRRRLSEKINYLVYTQCVCTYVLIYLFLSTFWRYFLFSDRFNHFPGHPCGLLKISKLIPDTYQVIINHIHNIHSNLRSLRGRVFPIETKIDMFFFIRLNTDAYR